MFLKQYRGEGWPILGDFAVGVMKTTGAPTVKAYRGDSLIDLEVRTPKVGLYVWYRTW